MDENIIQDLSTVCRKLQGLGELFCMARGEPPPSAEALIGISDIIIALAVDVENTTDSIKKYVRDHPRRIINPCN
jgi:hypothetical protein